MGIAGFFLLVGMLLSELALFGVAAAGAVGAALLVVSAGLLVRHGLTSRAAAAPDGGPAEAPVRAARQASVAVPRRA